jgi:hypothetical protein
LDPTGRGIEKGKKMKGRAAERGEGTLKMNISATKQPKHKGEKRRGEGGGRGGGGGKE